MPVPNAGEAVMVTLGVVAPPLWQLEQLLPSRGEPVSFDIPFEFKKVNADIVAIETAVRRSRVSFFIRIILTSAFILAGNC